MAILLKLIYLIQFQNTLSEIQSTSFRKEVQKPIFSTYFK